jgi:hypothetical protein
MLDTTKTKEQTNTHSQVLSRLRTSNTFALYAFIASWSTSWSIKSERDAPFPKVEVEVDVGLPKAIDDDGRKAEDCDDEGGSTVTRRLRLISVATL